jgi:hypothetical protein
MNKKIKLDQVCDYFQLDINLVREFADFGLYPTIDLEGETGLDTKYLDQLREVVSLHQALGINKEGIDVILELRTRVSTLQRTIKKLEHDNKKLRLLLGAEEPWVLESQGLIIEIRAELQDDVN